MTTGLRLDHRQQAFVDEFLGTSGTHLLTGAPGTGKTSVVIAVLSEAFQRNIAHRALLLCSRRILVSQYATRLAAVAPSLRTEVVDGPRRRELLSLTSVGESPWPTGAVLVMTSSFFARPGVHDSLELEHWDVLVVDELPFEDEEAPETIGELNVALRGFLDSSAVTRALFLDGGTLASSSLGRELRLTEWHLERTLPEIQVVSFSLSASEADFLKRVDRMLHELMPDAKTGKLRDWIGSQLKSSPYALEQTVLRVRGLLARSITSEIDDYADGESDRSPLSKLAISEPQIATVLCRELLSMLDRLATDARLEALRQLIETLINRQLPRICIFVASTQTAAYLISVLNTDGFDVVEVSEQMNSATLQASLLHFRDSGGILVATDTIIQGLAFTGADVAINYEPPLNSRVLNVRMTRADFKEVYDLQVSGT